MATAVSTTTLCLLDTWIPHIHLKSAFNMARKGIDSGILVCT
jgi:hypothetical protein